LEFGASVGFIHKELVTMHGHTISKDIWIVLCIDAVSWWECTASVQDEWNVRMCNCWNDTVRGKPKFSIETYSTANLSTTNSTWRAWERSQTSAARFTRDTIVNVHSM